MTSASPAGPERPGPALPRWILAADAAAVFLLALAAWQVLSGGARGGVLRFVVPETSLMVLLLALAGVVAARHAVRPTPSILTRVRGGLRRLGAARPFGSIWPVFVSTRLMVFVVAFFAVAAIGEVRHAGFQLSGNPLVNLPFRFDAGWYGGIALNGYTWYGSFEQQNDIAFFPAMPMLMRPIGYAFGAGDGSRPREVRMARMLWGGVALSLAALLFGLVHLARLGSHLIGEERGGHAVLLLACYPFAFAFNAPYTESLFLLSSVAAAHHFYRGHWVRSGAWGLLAGLTRPNGFLLAVPLGLLALQWMRTSDGGGARRLSGRARVHALAAASMPVAGMLAFTVYLVDKTGVWFAWSRSHAAWGRTFEGVAPITNALARLGEQGLVTIAAGEPFSVLNAAALLFTLGLTWPVYRRLGAAWAVYVLLIVVPPLLAGGVLSMGRITATIFPIFLALAAVLPARAVPGWAAAFAILQGLCAALFFTWRQLY
jgi:hypothetical protein